MTLQRGLFFLKALLLLLLATSCDSDHTHNSSRGPWATVQEAPVTYREKSGLCISTETARWIGLKIVEVEERSLPGEWQFSALAFPSSRFKGTASRYQTVNAIASLNKGEAEMLQPGQSVRVTTVGEKVWPAQILKVEPQFHDGSGTVEVQMQIQDELGALTNDCSVTVTASLVEQGPVLAIPRAALLQSVEGWFVYVVNGESFSRTPVKMGRGTESFVEVKDGLYAGDRVVVQGNETLWLTELKFTKAGKACCPVTSK